MASLFGGQGVNVNDLPDDDFDAIPAGKYVVRIADSDVSPNKAGTGTILKLTIKVDEGEFAGRQFWEYLNIQHQKATAQNIGQAMLKKIVKAVNGPPSITDSRELHNIPFIADVKIEKSEQWGDSNKLKSVSPYQNPQPPVNPNYQNSAPSQHATNPSGGQPAQGSPPAPPASGAGGLPWEQNG
jgi:hypothetical protein